MNGRKPTKPELIYIEESIKCGCVGVRVLNRFKSGGSEKHQWWNWQDIDQPEVWTGFHHDPDFGSVHEFCHFFGYPLCAPFHQGTREAYKEYGETFPARHGNDHHYFDLVGVDAECCEYNWLYLPDTAKERIAECYSTNAGFKVWQRMPTILKNRIGINPRTGDFYKNELDEVVYG